MPVETKRLVAVVPLPVHAGGAILLVAVALVVPYCVQAIPVVPDRGVPHHAVLQVPQPRKAARPPASNRRRGGGPPSRGASVQNVPAAGGAPAPQ